MLVKLNNRGQNVLEYLLMVTVFIITSLVFLNPRGGPFHRALNSSINTSIDHLERMSSNLTFNWRSR